MLPIFSFVQSGNWVSGTRVTPPSLTAVNHIRQSSATFGELSGADRQPAETGEALRGIDL
jgi:hypothetical protein